MSLHKISSKCGIFAETDANTLLKGGVPVERDHRQPVRGGRLSEPRNPDQGQHAHAEGAAARRPEPVLSGVAAGMASSPRAAYGPNANVCLPAGAEPADCIRFPMTRSITPRSAASRSAKGEAGGVGGLPGTDRLDWWIERGSASGEGEGGRQALHSRRSPIWREFSGRYAKRHGNGSRCLPAHQARRSTGPLFVGCDFGSTTAKAVVLSAEKEMLYTAYVQSKGNPIEDAKALFRDIRGRRRRADRGACAHRIRQGSVARTSSAPISAWSKPSRMPNRLCMSSRTPT